MSFAEFCRKNNEPERLKLYDNEKSNYTAEEISFSCGKTKLCVCTCPDCNNSWSDILNKLSKRKPDTKNHFTNTKKLTYCPYCKGERVSVFYNMAIIYPEILPFFDYDNNKLPPEKLLPGHHEPIAIRCDKGCGFTKRIRAQDFMRDYKKENRFRCPDCGDGKNKGASSRHNIAVKFPEIAEEFSENMNNGLKASDISPSDTGKYWFKCKDCLNYFPAYVRNRCYRGDGCSVCSDRRKTSFIEQALYFYIKKCFSSAENRAYEKRIDCTVDILIPELDTVIEYSGEYYHRRIKNALDEDKRKLKLLTAYYKVFSIQEYPEEFVHPLLETVVFPVYTGRSQYNELNKLILDILKRLDKNRESYPNIDLDKHELEILQQYIRTPVKKSFAEVHPEDAKDWDKKRNGSLTSNMFYACNSSFKFWWTCRNKDCKRSYRAFMSNKAKQKNKNSCHYCVRTDIRKQGEITLDECYPKLVPYWHFGLNKKPLEEITPNSEQICIFRLSDRRIVPVKLCNLTGTLKRNPNTDIEKYLEKILKSNAKLY